MFSYLYRKKYSYGVRLRIPREIAPWFSNRDEIKLSLGTTDHKQAKEQARLVAGYLQGIFRNIKREVIQRAAFYRDLQNQAQDQLIRLDLKGEHSNGSDYPGAVNAHRETGAMLADACIGLDMGSPEFSKICLRMLQGMVGLYGELESRALNGNRHCLNNGNRRSLNNGNDNGQGSPDGGHDDNNESAPRANTGIPAVSGVS